MKRLAMATIVLTAFAGMAQAGGLPKPLKMGERMRHFELTHWVRGESPRGSGGYQSEPAAEEARRDDAKPAKTAKGKDSKPQPAKAD